MAGFLRLLFLLLPFGASAQFTYVIDQHITVQDLGGNTMAMPWAGGLNAAQYNTMDLNNDGKDDLVLFDRMADKIITFTNENEKYVYSPQYEALFPEGVLNWILLRDYDCDGKKDIFTGDLLGIKVYRNVTNGGNLAWQQFFFSTGFAVPKVGVLLTEGLNGKVNLMLQTDDLPAISDADGDGDLDIFNVRFAGNGNIEFHRNMSKENNHGCDSLEFERTTTAWGNFRECSCGVMALHGQDCPAIGRVNHAGGKSLLAIDINGDQQQDLVFSEASCNLPYQLINEGTLQNPVINSYTPFPTGAPANIIIYPAVYHEDVDFDGLKDLIASPNSFTKEFRQSDFARSNLFYKNTGSATSPVFSFVKRNFLQEHMIDVGDNSVPAFADYDGDGDYDMFISKSGSPQLTSSVSLYENTGTPAAPAFKLINDNYLFFGQSDFYNLKLQFADMDGDNTTDLVFTATSLATNVTDLHFLPNKSQRVFDFEGQPVTRLTFDLVFDENICVTDVNADSHPDILLGTNNGALQYWRNSGLSPLNFVLENDHFLGLQSSVLRQNITCAVADLDADGNGDLLYGDQTGTIKIISDFRNAADATGAMSEIVFNPLLTLYKAQDLGGRIWPAAVNLFNSTNPAIVTGNILGGIQILRHDEGTSLPPEPDIAIYPNPVDRTQTLSVRIDRMAFMQVLSILGQQLDEPVRLQAHQTHHYTLPQLAAGLYLLRFTIRGKTHTRRLVVR